MELPTDVIIESITKFSVIYFKDKRHDPNAPAHNYITVPVKDDSCLLLCIITSQISKREEYYGIKVANKKALSSLVYVDSNDLPILTKRSVIDCNQAEFIRKKDLIEKIIDDSTIETKLKVSNIPDKLKKEIIEAINNSPFVKPYIKEMISYNKF